MGPLLKEGKEINICIFRIEILDIIGIILIHILYLNTNHNKPITTNRFDIGSLADYLVALKAFNMVSSLFLKPPISTQQFITHYVINLWPYTTLPRH